MEEKRVYFYRSKYDDEEVMKDEAIRSEIEKAYNAFVALRDKYEWESSLDIDEIIGVLGEELAE